MLIRKEDMDVRVVEHARDGEGSVEFEYICPKEDTGVPNLRMCAVMNIKPGCSIGAHTHVNESEVYFVMEGQATVTCDGVQTVLSQGDTLVTENGKTHMIKNHTDKLTRVLGVIVTE